MILLQDKRLGLERCWAGRIPILVTAILFQLSLWLGSPAEIPGERGAASVERKKRIYGSYVSATVVICPCSLLVALMGSDHPIAQDAHILIHISSKMAGVRLDHLGLASI